MLKEAQYEAEERMRGAVEALEEDLAGVRTGRASPALVEDYPLSIMGCQPH